MTKKEKKQVSCQFWPEQVQVIFKAAEKAKLPVNRYLREQVIPLIARSSGQPVPHCPIVYSKKLGDTPSVSERMLDNPAMLEVLARTLVANGKSSDILALMAKYEMTNGNA